MKKCCLEMQKLMSERDALKADVEILDQSLRRRTKELGETEKRVSRALEVLRAWASRPRLARTPILKRDILMLIGELQAQMEET